MVSPFSNHNTRSDIEYFPESLGVMADVQVVRLAHVAHSTPVFAALYKDVNNAAFLRKQLVEANADYEYAFLDASVVS